MDANEIRSKVDALADDYFTFGADHMAHKVAELQATLTEAHGFVPDLLTVVVARVNEIASEEELDHSSRRVLAVYGKFLAVLDEGAPF